MAAALWSAGCLTADGVVRPDGSASVTLTFPTSATPDDDHGARVLVTAPDVTVESLAIGDASSGGKDDSRLATAKLTAKKAEAFEALPLLRVVGASIKHEPAAGGGGVLRIVVKNPAAKKDDKAGAAKDQDQGKRPAVVRIQPPGPVVETSATAKDGVVEWSFPVSDWQAGKQLELTIKYGPASASAEDAPSTS